jgi:signal transduction histidine kinase
MNHASARPRLVIEPAVRPDPDAPERAPAPALAPVRAPEGAPGLPTLLERALQVPLLGKLAGANLVIVASALLAVAAERQSLLPGTAVPILGIALGLSLVVNLVLVYVALRPLSDLEAAASRVSAGDIEARVAPSILADRNIARVGATLNALLDRVTEERARVRRLAAQVISVQDEERARVARELHDSTAQILAAIMLQLGVAARESSSPALDDRIAMLRELAAEALEEVRSLSHTMHPRVLDDLGLAAALEWIARQTRDQESFDVEVIADEAGPPIPAPLASVLYRVAQEALRNAARHASASRVEIFLRRAPGSATLEVTDDGRGFDVRRAEERRPGMGMFSMRERVALVNGVLTVESAPGRGTRIVATVPLTDLSETVK